jgi:DNA-binding IclR family transcriptional regulator
VRNPPEVVYVDKVERPQRIRYSAELGERRPLHCTAPGLAVLAFLPDAEREVLVETLELERFTDRTVTDRRLLRARLAEIQRAGVAVNVDEFIAGASGIASLVFDHAGVPVGTCSVIGPTSRLVARKDRVARWVKRAAGGVSRQLGFVPTRRG